MKFRFCGDQDCPDWFLTQMATLSRLSSVKAKLLAQHVAGHLSGHEMKSEKTDALLADSKLPEDEVRSLLASIQFVLSSASRFETSEEHLRAELQQIGLPREHATALAKVHHDATEAIRRNLVRESIMARQMISNAFERTVPFINTLFRHSFTVGLSEKSQLNLSEFSFFSLLKALLLVRIKCPQIYLT
nr:EOG090X0HLW [Ilyocryptus agilis]